MRINPFQTIKNKIEDNNQKARETATITTVEEKSDSSLKTASDAITAMGKASINFKAKKVDSELEKKIIQKHKEGLSNEEIATELSGEVSHTRINMIIENQKRVDRIVELYTQGKTKSEISKILGTTEQIVIQKLKKLENIEIIDAEHIKNTSRTIVTDDLIEKMIELYKEGNTAEQIGKIFGCSELTVSRRLKKLENWQDIKEEHTQNYNKTNQGTGKRTIITEETLAKIVELYKQGLSAKKIGEIVNCGETTVARCISKQSNKAELEIEHKANSTIRTITKEEEKNIAELYKQGKSLGEISKITNLGPERVLSNLKKQDNWEEIEKEHTKNKKLTVIRQELVDKMVELYKQGKSINEIANILGCGESSVSRHITKQENKDELIKSNKENSPQKEIKEATIITPDRLNQIIELFKNGKSFKEISLEIGCNQTTVARKLRKLENWKELEKENIKNSPRTIITTDTVEKMVELFKQGKSANAIANILHCNPTTVLDYIEKQPNKNKIKEEHAKNRTQFSVNQEYIEKMIEMYKQGKSTNEIAKILGCSKTTVKNQIKKSKDLNEIKQEHIKNFNAKSKDRILVTKDIVEEMARLRKEGKSTRRIATILGCSKNAVINNLSKREDYSKIEKEYIKNKLNEKRKTLDDIVKEYTSGTSIEELSKKYDYTESTIKCIIDIKQRNTDYTETKEHQYDTYNIQELQGRIVEFYINNTIENEKLENIIDFIDSTNKYITEENKPVLISLCRDLDKIEQNPNDIEKTIQGSNSIPTIEMWISKEKEEDEAFERLHEKIGEMHITLQTNELFSAAELLESLIPTNKNETVKIKTITELIAIVEDKLNTNNSTNKDKNYINNLITFYDYNNKNNEESASAIKKAIKIYNIDAEQEINIANITEEDNEIKEKIGQILNISNILDGQPLNQRLANEYKYFVDICRGKDAIKEKMVYTLAKLDNYFKQDNEDKYLYKNFEQLAKECILDQDIIKIFLEKIYKYTYKNIGNEHLNLELTNTVLEDNIWRKTLNAKEKSDFIKTLENGILDLNPRSKGRINVIKGEGKIESGGKKYQLVELKIDSQWRIFGYQDPNNGKNFIFDKIGRDDNGINNYKANFFKTHNF